jgi:hypothetical protein
MESNEKRISFLKTLTRLGLVRVLVRVLKKSLYDAGFRKTLTRLGWKNAVFSLFNNYITLTLTTPLYRGVVRVRVRVIL